MLMCGGQRRWHAKAVVRSGTHLIIEFPTLIGLLAEVSNLYPKARVLDRVVCRAHFERIPYWPTSTVTKGRVVRCYNDD